MKPNLWLYSTQKEQQSAAASLIIFGAEVFNKAKLVRDIEQLKAIRIQLDRNDINALPAPPQEIMEFSFDYLIDCVKILIFFENYMKAELIAKGYCVHVINKDHSKFKDLAKEQF